MAKNEMYPLSKLILQKNKIIFFILVLMFIPVISYLFFSVLESCAIKSFRIINYVGNQHESFDPDSCEFILQEIEWYNTNCSNNFEILDCS